MIIGCPKEIKDQENRVALTPQAVAAYVQAGHRVLLEVGAGLGAGYSDSAYVEAGGELSPDPAAIWRAAEMIVKVKEPLPGEYPLLRADQIVFTFFHLAASRELTEACLSRRIAAVAYETVSEGGNLPLLRPMSAVAGRMASLVGAYFLASPLGGSGILPTGVPGAAPAEVLILGAGVVGQNAAGVAQGLGCRVTIIDIDPQKLAAMSKSLGPGLELLLNDPATLAKKLATSDIIVGAVLVVGAKAPKLVSSASLRLIKPGSVLVDVAIDQGGCFESSRLTTHSNPVFVEGGVVHYCVGNMPGAYARTSTQALSEVTLPYGLELANKGLKQALRENPALRGGLSAYQGWLTQKPVAAEFGLLSSYKADPWV
ncbi:MAG: alanine dehydrogenase [Deltaproteobacteria bacterium]|jgi:alanine dehydrogenase|nr:alanine dehydrogenase [Deltaproteobacteria bacterium]